MAKKVLKHSRAARRGLVEDGDAKDLSKLPKAEPELVKKSIIRTTIKNENLLAKKMEMLKARKTAPKNLSKARKQLAEHKLGILEAKITLSIARARMVQGARKAGWEQINKAAVVGLDAPKPTQIAEEMVDEEETTLMVAPNPFAGLEEEDA